MYVSFDVYGLIQCMSVTGVVVRQRFFDFSHSLYCEDRVFKITVMFYI